MFQVLVFPLSLPLHGLKWSGVLIADSVGFRLNVHIPINVGVLGMGGLMGSGRCNSFLSAIVVSLWGLYILE